MAEDDPARREALKNADAECLAQIEKGRTGFCWSDDPRSREHMPWEVQTVTWPRSVAQITPYLYQRYQFRSGFQIDERGGLHDLFGLVHSYTTATCLQGPFFRALTARRALGKDLKRVLVEHSGVIRSEEKAALQEIIKTIREEARFAAGKRWTPLAGGGRGGKIRYGPESFKPRGGQGGRGTDPHFNRLVYDLGRLFHDRYCEQPAEPPRRRTDAPKGRTNWTDVALFLIATRAAWTFEKLPELYHVPLGKWRDPFRWRRETLQARAKGLLQSRSRRFEKSYHPRGFATPSVAKSLRVALARPTWRRERQAKRAWGRVLAAIARPTTR